MSTSPNSYEALIEKVLKHFGGAQFREELDHAKKEFFGSQNLLEEGSEQFELRMSQFFDWYFFTRELKGFGHTPLESCHLARELRFSPEEEVQIEALKNHRHSVFEFLKIKDGDVYIKDLLKNEKLVVRKSPWIFGFDPTELFEARLIPEGDSWTFAKGFCFHPESAKKFILAEAKRHRKDPDLDPDEFLLRLVKMRSKYEQYKHVRPEMIYTNDSKLVL